MKSVELIGGVKDGLRTMVQTGTEVLAIRMTIPVCLKSSFNIVSDDKILIPNIIRYVWDKKYTGEGYARFCYKRGEDALGGYDDE